MRAVCTTVLKVQLKGRLTVEERYVGKNIYIAFPYCGRWYLYPHDAAVEVFVTNGTRGNFFSTGYLSVKQKKFLEPYLIGGDDGATIGEAA